MPIEFRRSQCTEGLAAWGVGGEGHGEGVEGAKVRRLRRGRALCPMTEAAQGQGSSYMEPYRHLRRKVQFTLEGIAFSAAFVWLE